MLPGLQRMLGHPAARLLMLGVCFVVLSLPVLSGRAAEPDAGLIVELFLSWSIVIGLLAILAVVDRREAEAEPPGEDGAAAIGDRNPGG